MNKIQALIDELDIVKRVSDEEIKITETLLRLYAPSLRRSAHSIDEMEEACLATQRQSIEDFVNLVVDHDYNKDRQKITDRLSEVGHSMYLLSMMEQALLMLKDDPSSRKTYYEIIQTRYFGVYCKSHEDAYTTLDMPASTYYRNLKKAVRLYAAILWLVIIPDLIIQEQQRLCPESEIENQMRLDMGA